MFQKSSAGKKTHISGIMRLDSLGLGHHELGSSLPPLTDSLSSINKTKALLDSAYVPCFSNQIEVQRNHQGGIYDSFSNSIYGVSSNPLEFFPRVPPSSGSLYSTTQGVQVPSSLPFPGSVYSMQDQAILRALYENNASNFVNGFKAERDMVSVSQETDLTTDMNAETSSVVSNFEMGRRSFENQNQNPPPASAAGVDQDHGLWSY